MRYVGAALLVSSLLVGACGVPPLGPACPADFAVQVEPGERSIAIGESFTATATAVTCGGRDRAPYAAAWRSSNPQVAGVDASGRITGIGSGTAEITAHDPGVSANWSWGSVIVRVASSAPKQPPPPP